MTTPAASSGLRLGILRVLLLSAVAAFAGGLLYVFLDTGLSCCFPIGMLVCLIWLARDLGKRKRIGIADVCTALLVMILMSLPCLFHELDMRRPEGATGVMTENNLHAIGLALRAYHDKHGAFPPAAACGPDGTPLYSWRVLVLPFLDLDWLYSRFHLDEPWDSPHNRTLLPMMPRYYAAQGAMAVADYRSMTYYQAFVGPGAAFEGNKGLRVPADFPDGVEKTLLVVEAREAVPWTALIDLSFEPDQALPALGAPRRRRFGRLDLGLFTPPRFRAAMADGTARSFDTEMPVSALRAWITRKGSEAIWFGELHDSR